MNIEKYPQYQLYKFTLLLEENKAKEISGFKLKQKWEYEAEGKKYVSEHRQVRDCLIKYEKMKASKNLYELHRLRKKADYKLFNPLTEKEINDSIKYMENVLNELKFENK